MIIKNISYFVNSICHYQTILCIIYLHLIYCIEIWGHSFVSNLNSIYLIQKNILKIIVNKPNYFSTVPYLKKIDYYLYMIFVSTRLVFTCIK